MILTEHSCQAGATFVRGSVGDHESGKTFARTVRGLFVKISGWSGNNHNFKFWRQWFRGLCLAVRLMSSGVVCSAFFLVAAIRRR
jgi:hypothetical protein